MTDPLGHATVSLGLSSVAGPAVDVVTDLVAGARAAEDAGFDGVTLSEHHDGFAGYVPDPLSMTGVLRDRLERAWACAGPAILPLRNPVLVAEQLAWAEAVHPGRVAAAFVPGYQRRDFDLVGASFDERHRTHWSHLARLVVEVGPAGSTRVGDLAGDPAVGDLSPGGVSLLTGATGPLAVRRAAALGVGLLLPSLRPATDVRALVEEYRTHGGSGPVVLIRRVRVGSGSGDGGRLLGDWRSRADDAPWLDLSEAAVVAGGPEQLAEGLVSQVQESGCTALNLRIEADGDVEGAGAFREHLELLGARVLPAVREALGARSAVLERDRRAISSNKSHS